MNYKSEFEIRELIGRKAFDEVYGSHCSNIKIEYTDYKFETYDAFFSFTNSNGKKKYVVIEIKVRSADYSSYIFEEKKSVSMNKVYKELGVDKDDVKLLYVNFTPSAAYIYDVTNIDSKYSTSTLKCNKNTVYSTSDKVSKEVYYLPTSDAIKKVDYCIDVANLREEILKDI